MKVNVTNNDSIKIFSDVTNYVNVKDEHFGDTKASYNIFVPESSIIESSGFKRKKDWKIT